ncbi:hypothetical protein ACFYVK_30495 [Streptomyces chartreusis]|uniref:hypothetical protein n=1 Tax=Streptomyces chartreusis TaxID=1969 RepID=UPI00368EBB0E
MDRTNHDLIVFEENTDPEHQIVIIGHEAWHMFQGHGSHGTHGPSASRAASGDAGAKLTDFVTAIAQATRTRVSPDQVMDVALHFAARTDGHQVQEELEAEHFGFRFATDLQAALGDAQAAGDPRNLTGRIQASMAHRFRSIQP